VSKPVLLTNTNLTGDTGLAFERMLNKVGLNKGSFDYRGTGEPDLGPATPPVIIALGTEALDRVLGISGSVLEHRTQGRRGYVEWSPVYNCWAIGTYEPEFIQRGNWYLTGVFLSDLQRGLQIAEHGFRYRPPRTIEDPTPDEFLRWVLELPPGAPVAFDIETPGKAKAAEDELDFQDATPIERLSVSGRPGEGVSIIWADTYRPAIDYLFSLKRDYYVWNRAFDKPRLESNGLRFGGPVHDIMYAWHVLQPDLPMNINFVAPGFLPHYERWKFQHYGRPAYYSAVDSAALFDLAEPIFSGLRSTNQYDYYHRHIHQMTDALEEMTKPGVPVDTEARIALSRDLSNAQAEALRKIQTVVPEELIQLDPPQGFARTPANTEGLKEIRVTVPQKVCGRCGQVGVTKTSHTSKKRDQCYNAEIILEPREITRYARPVPFTPSNKQLLGYCLYQGHKPILSEPKPGKAAGFTFDSAAVTQLRKHYPNDPLYPLLQDYKDPEKFLGFIGKLNEDGELVGGWPTRNGRLYPIFGHAPATGRLNCKQPNLQQVPNDPDDPDAQLLRGVFKPEPGTAIVEIDYSAIEAVLVGYFAGDRWFTRLATLGIHDYLNSHILARRGIIERPADVSWSDGDLKQYFGELKERFKGPRAQAKTVVYLSLYMGSPYRMVASNPGVFESVKEAKEIQSLLWDLFPRVQRWQWDTTALAADQGYLKGVWGQSRRFYKVWDWKKGYDGWEKKPGEQAKEAVNFIIQNCAGGILKEAVLRCRETEPEVFRCIRLLIHDSVFGYFPLEHLENYGAKLERIMREPVLCLPVDPSWERGEYLSIGTEAKVSYNNWAETTKAPWKL
jgi:hypothetical protein